MRTIRTIVLLSVLAGLLPSGVRSDTLPMAFKDDIAAGSVYFPGGKSEEFQRYKLTDSQGNHLKFPEHVCLLAGDRHITNAAGASTAVVGFNDNGWWLTVAGGFRTSIAYVICYLK